MTIELVYHNFDSISGGISPFDETICRITKGEDVRLACPYLSVSYLKHVVEGCKSWRILTDVEAWLSSRSTNARQEIQDFILEHSDGIHHYKDLHAKIIVAGEHALAGSANFTEKGITKRIELSVLFSEEEQVEELRQWFDALWLQTTSVDAVELSAYSHALPDVRVESSLVSLTSNAPKVKAKMLANSKHQNNFPENGDAHKRLVARVKFAPSREWMNDYFELLKELISFTGLSNGDPRLVMSIPKDKILPVTINRRYVLAADSYGCTVFIFGSELSRIPELMNKSNRYGQFNPLGSEAEEEIPYLIWLKGMPRSVFSDEETDELKENWREAVLVEMRRGKTSPFRKFHEPLVYEAAVNLDYRRRVLEEAFY